MLKKLKRFIKKMMKKSVPLFLLLTMLLVPQMSYGTSENNEIVVKPYSKDWSLVRNDALDFYINEIVIWKTKFERSEAARLSERERLTIERNAFQDLYDLKVEESDILKKENFRLNTVVGNLVAASKAKDWALVASLLGNIIQAFR